MTYGYRGPSIDHGLLSPSGHMSKRARDAALKRENKRLFPPGYFDTPEPTEAERNAEEALRLRRTAANLRDLAARGMHPRKYPKLAAQLEGQAARLEAGLD